MSTQDYKKANYDQILFRVKKGKREEYQRIAESLGLGFWAFLQAAIEEFIYERSGESFTKAEKPKPESLSADEKRFIEEFKQLPADAQKYLIKAIKAINDK